MHQASYKAERDKGFYSPIAPPAAGGAAGKGRPDGTGGTPATRQSVTPIGQSKASAEEAFASAAPKGDTLREGEYRFGMTKIAENLVAMNALRADVERALAKKWKVKDMGEEEKQVAASIAQSIIFNEEPGEKHEGWFKSIKAYISPDGVKEIKGSIAQELQNIRLNFDSPESPVDSWMAGILLRSRLGHDKKPEAVASQEPKAPTVSLADVDRAATVAAKTVLSEVQASNGNSQLTIEVKQDERPKETTKSRKVKVVKTATGFDMISEDQDQK